MSCETIKLSPALFTIGCHRRRIAFRDDKVFYTNGQSLFDSENKEILKQKTQIFDFLNVNNSFVTIDTKGDIACLNEQLTTNEINGFSGVFAALESTESYYIAAHDLSHSVRVIDPKTLQTVKTITTPGIPNSLGSFEGTDTFVIADDRTLSVVDTRMDKMERSSVLSAQPVAIYCHNNLICVACDDRRIRLYDSRRLKTPTQTTKPASKNGTAALWTHDNTQIAAVGFDEGMTLVEPAKDVGQFKRCKYLAETPFISQPVDTKDGFALLTRGGIVHNIKDPIAFLRLQKEGAPEEDD